MVLMFQSAVLFLILYNSASGLAGQLPSPENVTINSYNMGLVLEWDPPKNSTERGFTYSAEYRGWSKFEAECQNTSSLSCDFTNSVSSFGTYRFRVRTELEGMTSDWVETEDVALDKISVIGPPDVKLQSRTGEIEVDITDPSLRKSDLSNIYSKVSYVIHYWIEGELKKEELRGAQRKLMLQNLTPKLRYCVQVHILMGDEKTSRPSNVTCEVNTDSDEVKPWLIAVVLVLSFFITMVSVILIALVVICGYKTIRYLHPQPKLPLVFKQFFSDLPKSPIFLAMQNSHQPEELYQEVSIFADQDASTAQLSLQQTESLKLNI